MNGDGKEDKRTLCPKPDGSPTPGSGQFTGQCQRQRSGPRKGALNAYPAVSKRTARGPLAPAVQAPGMALESDPSGALSSTQAAEKVS